MENAAAFDPHRAFARWREQVWPREHGSWSLALEPLVLGLLAAPSAAGAWFALAVLAVFFGRRPLRAAVSDPVAARRAEARVALAPLAIVVFGGLAGAVVLGGVAWLGWLAPAALAGAVFLFFDLQRDSRAELAEVAGAAAFAVLPAALAALAGWDAPHALALALVMGGRSVPTVLAVRAALRAAKTGVRHISFPVGAAVFAVMLALALVREGLVPRAAVLLLGLHALRAVVLLAPARLTLRARTIGMIEAGLGALFIIAMGAAWRA